MIEDIAARELTAEFHRLLDHEPAFRIDLGEALRAAERDGRRRRARTLAVRSGVAALAVAASTALVIAWPSQTTTMAPPVVIPTEMTTTRAEVTPTPTVTTPRPTRTTPAPTETTPRRTVVTPTNGTTTPTKATTTTAPMDVMARLERLVRQVAAPAGGVATVTTRDAIEKSVVLDVETEKGFVRVSARLNGESGSMEMARAMCVSEGDLCTTQWSSESAGAWSRGYTDMEGVESLLFVATYPNASPLWLGVTNYHPSGTKPLGPKWKDAGITVSLIRQAEADSGLGEVAPK